MEWFVAGWCWLVAGTIFVAAQSGRRRDAEREWQPGEAPEEPWGIG